MRMFAFTPRPAALLPLAAFCLVAFSAGCKKAAEEEPAATAVSVQAEKAAQGDLTEYVSGDATLSPLAQAAIVPKVAAPVKKFLVQRGAHVRQGQLLAVLDNADLSAAVTDTRGGLTQAQAAYDTSIRAQIPEDQQKAKLDVTQAKANLDVAKSVADARKGLLDQGAIPKRDYDTAQASYVQAQATYDIAANHFRGVTSVSNQAAIQSAQGALASARGKYEAATAGLNYSEVRSPINGVVTDRPNFAGEMPQAGMPVITVMDTSSLLAKVHLPQAKTQSIHVGSAADVTVAGMDEPLKGTVSLVSPALDTGSTTLEVWVKVDNRAGELKAGSPAHVQIAVQTLKGVTTVPNEALVTTKSGDPAVMVIGSDGTAKSRPVKVGITDGKDTQITGGISAGDEVITKGAYGMDSGTKVKVVAAGAEDDDEKGGDAKGADDKKDGADEKGAADAKPDAADAKSDEKKDDAKPAPKGEKK